MTFFLAGVFVGTAIGVILAALCAAAGDSESMSDALHADLVALERAEQSSIVAAVAWRRRALAAEAVGEQMYHCLSGLTKELHAQRYGGPGTPHTCCFEAVGEYERSHLTMKEGEQ